MSGRERATSAERWSIGELARLSGVSVRTLHHYDAVGILRPSGLSAGGYREYALAEAQRLAEILAYRACGLPLGEIAALLDADGTTRAEHLARQLELLDDRLGAMALQRQTLARAWEAQQMGITLDPEEYFAVFGDEDPRQYADEVRERWGESDAYAESMRRTATYSTEDWQRAREEWDVLAAEFRDCLLAGEAADGDRAVAAARAHREHISRWYYGCTTEIQVGLADMYVADPRFAANYEALAPGLAAFVRDAIYAGALRDS